MRFFPAKSFCCCSLKNGIICWASATTVLIKMCKKSEQNRDFLGMHCTENSLRRGCGSLLGKYRKHERQTAIGLLNGWVGIFSLCITWSVNIMTATRLINSSSAVNRLQRKPESAFPIVLPFYGGYLCSSSWKQSCAARTSNLYLKNRKYFVRYDRK